MASTSFPEAAAPIVDAFEARYALHVSWGGERVAEGTKLSPAQCKDIPAVCFEGEPGKLYTIVLSDPDAPNPTEPKFAEWIHW